MSEWRESQDGARRVVRITPAANRKAIPEGHCWTSQQWQPAPKAIAGSLSDQDGRAMFPDQSRAMYALDYMS